MSRVRVLLSLAAVVLAGGYDLALVRGQGAANRDAILNQQLTKPPKPNVAVGRAMFEKTCAPCHRFGPIGNDVGPDLTAVNSRFKKKDILESVLWPSKVISDQYQSQLLQTTDGTVYNGLIVRETAAAVQLRVNTDPQHPMVIPADKIQARRTATVSFMPEGLVDKATPQEIANLIGFIQNGPPGGRGK